MPDQDLHSSDFTAFFYELYGFDPFPWQQMLADRVTRGDWPAVIQLPTSSGKTACLDIAVFALACQYEWNLEERTAPRRVFFVVDRRIVVDEAYRRACELAKRLQKPNENQPTVRKVSSRLCQLSGTTQPLAVARLRGGLLPDNDWALNPAQPAVLTSTVDQVGSRLLFRSYGGSNRVAPVHAGLTGNDALILLDEAHCALPFLQTARAVSGYRSDTWSEQPICTPFHFSVMSATPPVRESDVFPTAEKRQPALDHHLLRKRMQARKPVELVKVKRFSKPKKNEPGLRAELIGSDALVHTAADHALRLAEGGRSRIAIMVNRVAKAREIYDQLLSDCIPADEASAAQIILMTGRMRPIDRDDLIRKYTEILRAGSKETLGSPVILVTTQCLEVGADFSFDALVTECAPLDSLRQRFGRLDRLGDVRESSGRDAVSVVLIRDDQFKPDDKLDDDKPLDVIYGNALARTWNWLTSHADASATKSTPPGIDFGIDALDAKLQRDPGAALRLSAPTADAPVMLPAHVDCWVQTAPQPRPDPDVALFLHGPDRSEPEVQIVWRADLDPSQRFETSRERDDAWVQAVSLCPPVSAEALSVPIGLLYRWLRQANAQDAVTELVDIEGAAISENEDQPQSENRHVVIWRGRRKSVVTADSGTIRPGETVVIPYERGDSSLEIFGCLPDADSPTRTDTAERAYLIAQRARVLRLNPRRLGDHRHHAAVQSLCSRLNDADADPPGRGELCELLRPIAHAIDDPEAETSGLPDWLRQTAKDLIEVTKTSTLGVQAHPCGGWVIIGRLTREQAKTALNHQGDEEDQFADDDDSASYADAPVTLAAHLGDVMRVADAWARRCLPPRFAALVKRAAELHDLGKADPRFQTLLHGGETAFFRSNELWGKSHDMHRSRRAQRQLRSQSGLPDGFRHEMLSMLLSETANLLPEDPDERDLVLHLVASHHGHARPFAPVVEDKEPHKIVLEAKLANEEISAVLSAEHLSRSTPAHRLDSGVPERFWRLTRRYGWWGLAYLETVLRLADWYASAHPCKYVQIAEPDKEVAA